LVAVLAVLQVATGLLAVLGEILLFQLYLGQAVLHLLQQSVELVERLLVVISTLLAVLHLVHIKPTQQQALRIHLEVLAEFRILVALVRGPLPVALRVARRLQIAALEAEGALKIQRLMQVLEGARVDTLENLLTRHLQHILTQ
jgi:hypothetical protein